MGVGRFFLAVFDPTPIFYFKEVSMNELIQNSFNALTMSSREIATLCDKEHRHVKRDIEVMAEQLKIDASKFGHIYLDSMNREQTEYLLDKETCLCLVAGYNAKLRMAIIKRWQELEQATTQKPVPLTFAEALRAYADEVEAHEQTKQTLAIAEPKAQYFDNLVERNLLTNFTTTAKEFGIKRKDFINYLLGNGYIYRDQQGNLLPYATHVPHLFEVKEYSKDAHSGVQTLITPRGRETIRLLLGI